MSIVTATLRDGRRLDYVLVDDPPAGGMKKTYFSPDKSYVVQFFHDQNAGMDPQRLARLDAILTRYNPTVSDAQGGAQGGSEVAAEYFRNLFCWPTGIVEKPEIGIVAPAYPPNFFFATGPFQGNEKQGRWFTSPKLRKMLPAEERGNWLGYFMMCILITRAVRRLHSAGLAHSDLSSKNILVDPSTGRCIVIDIDSLVVPGLFPPDVLGTPGYIAPEVLGTQHLPLKDPGRKHPCILTDLHALPVLLYEYLLFRHPLRGPRVHSVKSAEEDELLSMGSKAIFVEHPQDPSNRPKDLNIPCSVLGRPLLNLFLRAFVNGLHSPNERPAATEWERALIKTWSMLHPCSNVGCLYQWFVLHDLQNPRCPFCGTRVSHAVPVLKLRSERRPGQWMQDGQLVIYHNISLFRWHAFDNVFPGEEADRSPLAYCALHRGRWVLVNQSLDSLTSPNGNRVPPGSGVELRDGAQIRLSQEPRGRIAQVQMVRG